MWHRFEFGLRAAVMRACSLSGPSDEPTVSTRTLLWGLVEEKGATVAQLLARLGLTPEHLRAAFGQTPSQEVRDPVRNAGLTLEARACVNHAYQLAVEMDDKYIGGEHLLLAFVRDGECCDAGRALTHLGLSWKRVGRALMQGQKWRTSPPEGVWPPGLQARRWQQSVRGRAHWIGRLAVAATQVRQPFMPLLFFRKRTLDRPYAFYARLRRQPLSWDVLTHQWIVTGYEEVVAALAEPRFSHRTYATTAWGGEELPPLIASEFRRLDGCLGRQMLFLDAPDQTRQRSLVARRFTPRVVAQMQEQIQQVTDGLLDAAVSDGRMDVIAGLAAPMPMFVIARMLGLPLDQVSLYRRWSESFIAYISGEATLAQEVTALHCLHDLTALFERLIPQRRDSSQEDLLTLLLKPDEHGDRLTDEEVIGNALLLLAAGHENTTRLIGNSLLALLRRPDQLRRLREEPSQMVPAVEELLRFAGPVHWTTRITREDFHWHGRLFVRGQMVRIGLAAANHDPAQFPGADRLDISRVQNRHVAFGNGPHFCLGAALTRLETQIALGSLLARFPRLHLDRPPVQSRDAFTFRGLESLHIRTD